MFTPPNPEGGKKLEGTADEQVKQLLDVLMEKERAIYQSEIRNNNLLWGDFND